MYKKLQKLLEQGKTVLVEVDHSFGNSVFGYKYRLVTPKSCHYDHMYNNGLNKNLFAPSCFTRSGIGRLKLTPKIIVSNMKQFDKSQDEKIVKLMVIK